ncbi:Uu.00g008770.m01.CDS01 [Anthostomella pinea]|uniref:Uu.00g008770.m01.CDS01 n=1 Tax=Anthostomella pinea TaxID=933095 RepID=A0AAI8VX99_9PEZI|nr:Uu.00g008770.m01.CDS01 [Anthostomella pinea]
MSARTRTAEQSIFKRPAPSAVTYDLSVPDQATIRLPPDSTWTSGPHWHDNHTEFLQVLSGHAEIRLSGTMMPSVSAIDGVVIVPRGTVHEWRRSPSAGLDDELVVKEWTDPKDGQKEAFFKNLNGIILDAISAGDGSWRMRTLDLELRNLFWRMDNWPEFLSPSWPGWIQGAMTRFLLLGSVIVGKVLGCRGSYEEYCST